MRGLGVFDAWTIQKDPPGPRCIGDIAISWNGQTLVGFENHSGRTYLGTAQPLGKVLKGYGNNAEDHMEGAVYRNTFGTYLHGSLLPKNPHFADHLIKLALQHKYGPDLDTEMEFDGLDGASPVTASTDKYQPSTSLTDELEAIVTPLDDKLEWEAHSYMLEHMGLHKATAIAQKRH
jgi:CobQ-like glutamine amidotransferase family enzyme